MRHDRDRGLETPIEVVHACAQFPLGKKLAGIWEPTVAATVILPSEYVGAVMELFQDRRGSMTEHTHLEPARTLLRSGSTATTAACVARLLQHSVHCPTRLLVGCLSG